MNRKIMILVLFVCLTLTLSVMSHTYSRYVVGTDGVISSNFATWQILVNEHDIVANASSDVSFTPVFYEDENITSNTIAPTSIGYFDINIDPSSIGLSFRYTLTINNTNAEISDLHTTKYEILDSSLVSNPDNIVVISNNVISNTMLFENSENFRYEPFTLRVYFEWYDGSDNVLDDEADTSISNNSDLNIVLSANITFEQVI